MKMKRTTKLEKVKGIKKSERNKLTGHMIQAVQLSSPERIISLFLRQTHREISQNRNQLWKPM